MRQSSVQLAACIAGTLGFGLSALASDDSRPLPPASTLAVGLDDALATVRSRFPAVQIVDARIARHGPRWVYFVQAFRGSTVRTFKFDVSSGATVVNKRETARGRRLERLRETVRLLSGAATTRVEAIAAAELAVPGARAYEVELDDLNDLPVFKVKLIDGARRVTVLVSAGGPGTGGVVLPMPSDGVVDLSFDDAVSRAESLFPGEGVVKIELDDDRNFDDSGSYYNVRLASASGQQRRDIRLNANTGTVLRNRVSSVSGGNVSEFQAIVAANPAVSFAKAAAIAAESVPGSRVHEVELDLEGSGLEYKVELFRPDSTVTVVRVSATTGQLLAGGVVPAPNPMPGGGSAITAAQAASIALAQVPGTTVRETSLSTENGVPVFEVKLIDAAGARTDVSVAIATGAVVRIRPRG